MKKIDIILPYWGDPRLFIQTVESVMAQSNPNWRLLIFDDNYPELQAQDYIATLSDARITYYRHPKNIGITNNFNYALKRAGSEYCSLIGCDDLLLPDYVETALNSIGSADFYQSGVEVIDAENKVYRPLVDTVKNFLRPKMSGNYEGEKLATSLCIGNWLYFPSIVWKTSVLQKYEFNAAYKVAEDMAVELAMIVDGHVLKVDNTVTFQYRRFENSVSSREKGKKGNRFNEEEEVYENFSKIFKEIGWNKASMAAKIRPTSRLHRIISYVI